MSPLTSPQRAAVVLAQLDDERAQALLKKLSDPEVAALMAEMARLPTLAPEDVMLVVEDFVTETGARVQVRQGGLEVAKRWATLRLGPARAAELMTELEEAGKSSALNFLHRVEPSQLVGFLGEEHPQTAAVICSQLNHDYAARVFELLDEDLRAEVVRRLAKLGPVPSAVVDRIAAELQNRMPSFVRDRSAASEGGGVAAVVAVLNSTDPTAEKQILSKIAETDPELAETIRNEMFVFEDLVKLEDSALQVVLRTVPVRELALALKGKPSEIVTKVTTNMSERAAQDLDEEMASLGPQRLSAVEGAEGTVVKAIRDLTESGEIVVGRANDELVG
ncbi:MAG TPA: flagellar motor switch protein FliG [Acidimicrobiales bacterium]|nr:flagellar motor switch protein FliG [Acidimicrobiales bacterium]